MEHSVALATPALVIRWSRWRQVAMLALSSGFIALAVIGWPILHASWNGIPAPLMLGCAVVMFVVGLLAFSHAVVRLATASITGRMDDDGIFWARWSARTIPWSAMTGYAVAAEPNEAFVKVINLWLAEPAAWPPDGRLARLLNRRRLLGYGQITLDFRGTDCAAQRAINHIAATGKLERLARPS